MKDRIEAVRRQFDRNAEKPTANGLVNYPEETLGRHLGMFLLRCNFGQNVYATNDDALQLLITGSGSFADEIAVQFYLLGNGCFGLRRLGVMAIGLALRPNKALYFFKKYKEGKNALRLFDVYYLGLLHLPLQQVKDTFLIK
ncbi:hypothetical protein [Flavobacterium rhizosphaerae]|uniref:Uncharacterized protein n=1 Tax=Flavobacterium rhizosphaerae TaxID=3163298 RepID=A0ABW8YXY6_9FLAO